MLHDADLNESFGEVKQEPSQQSQKRRRPAEENQQPGYRPRGNKIDELITTLARLALRQEEEIQVLKQDHSYMMFMRPGKDSILHYLFQTAAQKQAESPTWGICFQPARTVLSLALFRDLVSWRHPPCLHTASAFYNVGRDPREHRAFERHVWP